MDAELSQADLVAKAIEHHNAAVKLDAIHSGGTIDPLDMLQRVRLMAIEVATTRELLFDLCCTDPEGGVDHETRPAVVNEFLRRLEQNILAATRKLQEPRLDLSHLNGKGR